MTVYPCWLRPKHIHLLLEYGKTTLGKFKWVFATTISTISSRYEKRTQIEPGIGREIVRAGSNCLESKTCPRLLYEDDDPRGVPAHSVRKIKAIMAALEFADNLAQVATMPGWKLHPLRGDRKSEYGITVTGNCRITFRLQGNAVTDVNFEDYH